jgi:hypothetical protein
MLKIARNKGEVHGFFTNKAGYEYSFQNAGMWFSRLIETRLEDLGYKEVDAYTDHMTGKRHFYVAVGKCFEKEFFSNRLDQLCDAFDDGKIVCEQAREMIDEAKKLLATIINEVQDTLVDFSVEDNEDAVEYSTILEENEALHKEVLTEMALGEYWKKAYLETWDYQLSKGIVNLRIRFGRYLAKLLEMFRRIFQIN